jgi:hypothetical protein
MRKSKIPEVMGRLCRHNGLDSVEISCPYCGALHYHSPKPVPGYRESHCGIPQLCRKGAYYIKATYTGDPQPKRQPKEWLNFWGDRVLRISF